MHANIMPRPSGGQEDAKCAAEAPEQRLWVSAPLLARELGIHRRTLARWLREVPLGFPRPVVIRTRLYFARDEVEAWKLAAARQAMAAR
jgi:hypothetical protein